MRYRAWKILLAGLVSTGILAGCSGDKKKVDNPSKIPPTPTGAGKSKPPAAAKAEK